MKQTNLQKAQARLREKFIKNGVKMLAPETVYFSKDTKIGKNVTIEPYVVLGEKVKIQNNSKIKSFSLRSAISLIFSNIFLFTNQCCPNLFF